MTQTINDIITANDETLQEAADVGVVTVPRKSNHKRGVLPGLDNSLMLLDFDETLLIAVRELEHLFVDLPKNPFSLYEVELMGESGLKRIVRLLSSTSAGALAPFYHVGHKYKRIIVLLPPSAILPETTQQQARDALTRYCELKIADNRKELFITKRRASRLLMFGFCLLLGCMGLSLLFNSEKFPDSLWATTLAEGFNIIGWVFLWHPFEAYMYDPIPITIESRIYSFLNQMEMEIRPQSEIEAAVERG